MVVNCPSCGKKTALLNNICEHCGCKARVCPECGNIVGEESLLCDYCGWKFESKEVQTERKKKDEEFLIKEKSKEHITYLSKTLSLLSLTSLVIIVGFILLGIALFKTVDFGDIKGLDAIEILAKVESASDTKSVINTLIIFGLVLIFIGRVLQVFRMEFSLRPTFNEMRQDGFDYKKFCVIFSNWVKSTKEEQIYNAPLKKFIKAIMLHLDTNVKLKRFINNCVHLGVFAFGLGLIYLGLKDNVDLYFKVTILKGAEMFKFDLNAQLVVGMMLLAVSVIHNILQFISENNKIRNWISKFNPNEII